MQSKLLRLVMAGGMVGGMSMLGYALYEKGGTVPPCATTYDLTHHKRWNSNWDGRDPVFLLKSTKKSQNHSLEDDAVELKKLTPRASRHILFIRHGQYHEKGDDDSKQGLTALGREQADLTGQRLKDLGLPYSGMMSSTMTRAKETADIAHSHLPSLPLVHTELLCEGAPIPTEPRTGNWRSLSKFAVDGTRIEAAFRNIIHRADPKQEMDSFEIIICHANVIRYFVCRALQFPAEGWQRIRLHHGSITWITIQPSGEVHMYFLGNVGHMPRDKITSNTKYQKQIEPPRSE